MTDLRARDPILRLSPNWGRMAYFQACKIGRIRKLDQLGWAEPVAPAKWALSESAEPTLRALGERDDVIKRIHRGLVQERIERSVDDFALPETDHRQVNWPAGSWYAGSMTSSSR